MMLHFGDATADFLGLTQVQCIGPRESPSVIGRSGVAQRNIDVTTSFLVKLGGLFGNDPAPGSCWV